jgi:hypothetical protein
VDGEGNEENREYKGKERGCGRLDERRRRKRIKRGKRA